MLDKIEVIIDKITGLETKTKVVDSDSGSKLVTVVRFQCEKPAGKFDGIQEALKASQTITAMFACHQLPLKMPEPDSKTDPRD